MSNKFNNTDRFEKHSLFRFSGKYFTKINEGGGGDVRTVIVLFLESQLGFILKLIFRFVLKLCSFANIGIGDEHLIVGNRLIKKPNSVVINWILNISA